MENQSAFGDDWEHASAFGDVSQEKPHIGNTIPQVAATEAMTSMATGMLVYTGWSERLLWVWIVLQMTFAMLKRQ